MKITITCDDGMHAKVTIDGEPVRHAVALSLSMSVDQTPVLVLDELLLARGASSRSTRFSLGAFKLEADTGE